jgi:lysozyme
MKISREGINLIKRFEGLRLTAYRDAVGVPTIGYGSTIGVKMGDEITESRAEELLIEDLARFEMCVDRLIDVAMTQAQFDALTSFAFNVGCQALQRSTLRRKLNNGDYDGAANELLRWDKAGGRVLRGLTRRREAERELFLSEPVHTRCDDPEDEEFDNPENDGSEPELCENATFRRGNFSTCVGVIQQALNKWAGQSNLVLDCDFGPRTYTEIRLFQIHHDLAVDGIVGPETWKALGEYL